MQDENDFIVAPSSLVCEEGFEALAAVTVEGSERVAQTDRPIDADDDPAEFETWAPTESGLDDPRKAFGFAVPGPLSETMISPVSVDTLISISGAVSASSAASSALSTSSLRMTSGQSSTGCPVCITSSF
jgi:hypothetical protein